MYEILHDRINLFSNVIFNFDIYSAKKRIFEWVEIR